MAQFILVLDTPGIKQFVFGTDALAEVRGASALLDRLNRDDTEEQLERQIKGLGGRIEKVYANGGAAQFVVQAPDRAAVQQAVDTLAAYYAEQTGGEVRVLAGIAEWPGEQDYQAAVQMAYTELQLRRNFAFGYQTAATLPIMQECESASHLPASGPYVWGGEQLILSDASRLKREESVRARRGVLWTDWIASLDLAEGALVDAARLRPKDTVTVGEYAERHGYIGLIYADGNAMGRLVQELDSKEVCRAFAELVDGSLREACYASLKHVLARECEWLRKCLAEEKTAGPLPADILLLGGDDLLVLLPADRALEFAWLTSNTFTALTKERLADAPMHVQSFFAQRGLVERGLTISCGVAIGPARYPFYLLLELAEDLLRSAKAAGSSDSGRTDYWAPTYIDFHQLAGSESPELAAIREEDYLVQTECPRTLRPYRSDQLATLREAAMLLRSASIPHSKLHDLFEAALEPRPVLAELRARELFGRLRQAGQRSEREALWDGLTMLRSVSPYPWTAEVREPHGLVSRKTALADLIEAHELFV